MGNNTSVLDIYGNYKDLDINYFTSQDYFVHMLRFSKMAEVCKGKNVLDIGCGHYTNLLKAICLQLRGPEYKSYVGTDYNKIQKWRASYEPIWSKSSLLPQIDFTDLESVAKVEEECAKRFDGGEWIATCFEVLEHMDFEMQNKFLYNLSRLMRALPGEGTLYFSTPNHNGSPAKNHISELSYKLLEEMFSRYGLEIKAATGLSAWKKFCKPENLEGSLAHEAPHVEQLPQCLQKIAWGAALPRQFSNNILYELKPSNEKLASYEKLRAEPFKWEEWRQGGKKQADCASLFSLEEAEA